MKTPSNQEATARETSSAHADPAARSLDQWARTMDQIQKMTFTQVQRHIEGVQAASQFVLKQTGDLMSLAEANTRSATEIWLDVARNWSESLRAVRPGA